MLCAIALAVLVMEKSSLKNHGNSSGRTVGVEVPGTGQVPDNLGGGQRAVHVHDDERRRVQRHEERLQFPALGERGQLYQHVRVPVGSGRPVCLRSQSSPGGPAPSRVVGT